MFPDSEGTSCVSVCTHCLSLGTTEITSSRNKLEHKKLQSHIREFLIQKRHSDTKWLFRYVAESPFSEFGLMKQPAVI